jgi:Fur family ferric uptake transcriptional regulator
MLRESGLRATPRRRGVLEAVGNSGAPLSARQVHAEVRRHGPINPVTVYRILDLLTDAGVLESIGGGRSLHYGLAPNPRHPAHPHFYCRKCGRLQCLTPDSIGLSPARLRSTSAGRIEKVAVRLEGICRHCLRDGAETAA